MKLKKTCRTCKHLDPTTYDSGYYDTEENYCPEKYPSNCDLVDDWEDVDSVTNCRHYEPIYKKLYISRINM